MEIIDNTNIISYYIFIEFYLYNNGSNQTGFGGVI
jgi:hypothetical protein